jgi:spermidine/putrescine transport system substrate-binding protein
LIQSDGTAALNNLVNPSTQWGAGFLYNGDALDAYYAADNFKWSNEKRIKIIRTKNPIYVLDGIVLIKKLPPKYKKNIYNTIYKAFYKGALSDVTKWEDDVIKKQPIMNNFDFTNYREPYKNVDTWISENYFDNDKIAKSIYKEKEIKVVKDNLRWPVDDKLMSEVIDVYQKVYQN